ncbi:hypothetical protein D3C80_1929760 [compost metagenome]
MAQRRVGETGAIGGVHRLGLEPGLVDHEDEKPPGDFPAVALPRLFESRRRDAFGRQTIEIVL